jgi:tetratricopeptide (TPR) repeat protein
MKMKPKRILASLLIQLFMIASSQGTQANPPGFALHLYRTGEYVPAILELDRFVYQYPEDPFVPYAQYLMALAHAQADQPRRSEATLRNLLENLEGSDERRLSERLYCECHVQLLNLLYREQRYEDFELEVEHYRGFCPDADPRLEAWVWNLELAVRVRERNWQEALELVRRSPFLENDQKAFFEGRIGELDAERRKSPILGGLFSILPGLGYLYAGRPFDGLRSFFINSAGIGLSVFCFVMGMPVLGTVFAMIEGVLFSANVYGGINAVIKQNAEGLIAGRDELLQRIPLPPLDVLTLREKLELP